MSGQAEIQQKFRGLACRHCGCRDLPVVYTRPKHGGRIMRRRECRHCGRRVTTWESSSGR
jgi:transcriptional regulator NrdR family protein